ncbi:MAG: hypothetical protein ACO1QS_11145 [Verrucomicrobiota bacterium]
MSVVVFPNVPVVPWSEFPRDSMTSPFKVFLIALLTLVFDFQVSALELKLLDGTTVTGDNFSQRTVGLVTIQNAGKTYTLGYQQFDDASLTALSGFPSTSTAAKAMLQSRKNPNASPKRQPTLNITPEEAIAMGLITLELEGNGSYARLKQTRTGALADRSLAICASYPLIIQPKDKSYSFCLLRPAESQLPGQAAGIPAKGTSFGSLQAMELGKPLPKAGDSFDIVEADDVAGYLASIRQWTGPVSTMALFKHFNPSANWDTVLRLQSGTEGNKYGLSGYKPEHWSRGERLLEYAKGRVEAREKNIGKGPGAFEGPWVPVTDMAELAAAIDDLQAERQALDNLSHEPENTSEQQAILANRLKEEKTELLNKFKTVWDPLYFYHDHHWNNLPSGFLPLAAIEGDPTGDTRVATQGRWWWNGYRLFQGRSLSASTGSDPIGSASVAANGVALLQGNAGVTMTGAFKRSGAAVPVNVTYTKLVLPEPAAPTVPKTPSSGGLTVALPTVTKVMSITEAYKDGLITFNVRGSGEFSSADIQRTSKAGTGFLRLARYRALAATLEGAAAPEVYFLPARELVLPASGVMDFSGIVNLREANLASTKGTPVITYAIVKLEEADALTQYILASEHLRSSHRKLLLQVKNGQDSALLKRMRAGSETLEKLTGGNPEAWIAGNWTAAPVTKAQNAYTSIEDKKTEEQMLEAAQTMTPDQYAERMQYAQEMTRGVWSNKVRLTLQQQGQATAIFAADGGFAMRVASGSQPPTSRWWWDGRYIRFDRYQNPLATVGISPEGILCGTDFGHPILMQKVP